MGGSGGAPPNFLVDSGYSLTLMWIRQSGIEGFGESCDGDPQFFGKGEKAITYHHHHLIGLDSP